MEKIKTGCPACGKVGKQKILKNKGILTVKCLSCEHVHKVNPPEKPDNIEKRVIISQGEESFPTSVSLNPKKTLKVGEERVLECEEGLFGVEITSLESEEKRLSTAKAEEIETIWARSIDNVKVSTTIHHESHSESYKFSVPGDYKFVIGRREKLNKQEFTVTHFITRDGGKSSQEGEKVLAKNVKRIYGEK